MDRFRTLAGIALLAGAAALAQPAFAQQTMTAYVGMQILFDAIKTAGSTDIEKVRAAAARMDKPAGSYEWQSGKLVTVFPKNAVSPGVQLKSLARN